MPKYIKELTLDISGKRNNQTITAKQGDNKSRFIRITLVDGETKVTLEQGENVDFRCLKPDKKSCKLPTTIEEGGTILVELDDNSLAVAGLVRADVEINNADGLALSSTTFYIQVEPSADNGNYIPSTSNQKMARSLDMDGHGIQNLPAPTENGDAVNKEYVDSLQSDMNVNDESDPAFIKNRTHWKEEVEVDYLVLPYLEPIPGLGFAPYGKKIGLELGETYTIEVETPTGELVTFTATATELPKDVFGIELPGVVFLYQQSLGLKILDGVDGDITENEIYLADNCYYNFYEDLQDYKIKIRDISGTDTITHKLPKEYYDIPEVDQVFNSESENAQSGIAVEQAIEEYDKSLMVGTEKIEDGSIIFSKMQQFTENVYVEYTSERFSMIEHSFGKVVTSVFLYLGGVDVDLSNCDTDTIELLCGVGVSSCTIPINVDDIVTTNAGKCRLYISCAFEIIGQSLNHSYGKVTIEIKINNKKIMYQGVHHIHKNSGSGYTHLALYLKSNINVLPITPYTGILISSK